MNPQLLYQQEPFKLEFNATVTKVLSLADGRSGVILDRTWFYPTGGGQEHDTGWIGEAKVVDVYKDAENRLVHVVEGGLTPGAVQARIDPQRRLRHMQHHTAQHLLTQCILRQAGVETISANINGYTPSTLDLSAPVSEADLELAEQQANQLIYEDRLVKTYFVSPEELKSIPLRKPPKVNENIRIVEIDGFDYSPCGGTHVAHTGSIGLLKVLKTERQNEKQRVFFVAGWQAYELFHHMYAALSAAAGRMSTSWQEIPDQLVRQAEQLNLLQKELQGLRQERLKYEAQELVDHAEAQGRFKLVRASFAGRPVAELRLLAEGLKKEPDLVSCLASYEGQKVSLIVTCGEGTGLDARQLLSQLLESIHGRGGGDPRLAQGGGVASPDQLNQLLAGVELSGL